MAHRRYAHGASTRGHAPRQTSTHCSDAVREVSDGDSSSAGRRWRTPIALDRQRGKDIDAGDSLRDRPDAASQRISYWTGPSSMRDAAVQRPGMRIRSQRVAVTEAFARPTRIAASRVRTGTTNHSLGCSPCRLDARRDEYRACAAEPRQIQAKRASSGDVALPRSKLSRCSHRRRSHRSCRRTRELAPRAPAGTRRRNRSATRASGKRWPADVDCLASHRLDGRRVNRGRH